MGAVGHSPASLATGGHQNRPVSPGDQSARRCNLAVGCRGSEGRSRGGPPGVRSVSRGELGWNIRGTLPGCGTSIQTPRGHDAQDPTSVALCSSAFVRPDFSCRQQLEGHRRAVRSACPSAGSSFVEVDCSRYSVPSSAGARGRRCPVLPGREEIMCFQKVSLPQ